MHINHFRGESRDLVWRRRSRPSTNPGHPNDGLDYKIRRATCDLEEPRHRRGARERPWVVMIHYRDSVAHRFRRYETEKEAREGIRAMKRSSWWARTPMTVVFKP